MRAKHLRGVAWLLCVTGLLGCGDDASSLPFRAGDEGHPEPLGAQPGEARAGVLSADALPPFPSGLEVWEGSDFVLANDRVALVIEAAGASDLYDPWGGKPVGMARVQDGELVEPTDFGEFFILTGRTTVLAQDVSVLNDGSDGNAAVVRAQGPLSPLPFFESLVGGVFPEDFEGVPTAIDYVLEPDSDHVDVFLIHRSERETEASTPQTLHGYMYTPRTPTFSTGVGFDTSGSELDFIAFIDDDATSYAYSVPGETMAGGVSASGFESNFTDGVTVPPGEEVQRHHARLTIGGPGLDPLLEARARSEGHSLRTLSGVVRDSSGNPAEGVRVHAETAGGAYLTRARTDTTGSYVLHVPEGQEVQLRTFRRGDAVTGPVTVDASTSTRDLALGPTGSIEVTATDAVSGDPLPVRVQVLPAAGTELPSVPGHFGEPPITSGRLHVAYPTDGQVTLPAPVGSWEVVVSRGYEYELGTAIVDVTDGGTAPVNVALDRVVDTSGVMCGDFHIHTSRSADSPDDARRKVRSAVCDGLEIPVRSDHEYVNDFQPLIEELGLEDYAFGLASVEMTSFVLWGHMGVFPLEPDASRINGGTPLWQRYPTTEDPDRPLETLSPTEVFADVRARPEEPVIIINHPRGSTNYFDYVGYDRTMGTVEQPSAWDEQFTLVEVFNDSGWRANRDETVADWLSFLDRGRRVFAIGSSDSHEIRSSPVGYPRTCLELGSDDPRTLTPTMVRDVAASGAATVSGGVYVDADVGGVGPGGEATGLGASTMVDVRVQAASWIEVNRLHLVVDGETVLDQEILPEDADPEDPVTRFQEDLPVDVAPGGSYVLVAAFGDMSLGPVHPGRTPFGVTNPIFLTP